jgi:predicted dehydrogenase
MSKIKMGIVGTGMISEYHLRGFDKIKNAAIKGATRDFYGTDKQQNMQRKKLEEFCYRNSILCYNNYKEMVADPDLDALIITSINPYHYHQIIQACDADKHVLVEKPVVTDFYELDIIRKKERQSKKIIFPGHNFIYRPAVCQAKKIIDSGKIGKIIYSSFISSHRLRKEHVQGWRSKKELGGGGALLDSGHHLIYQSLYLVGMPVKIQAFKSRLVHLNMDCEDIAQVNLLYADRSIGCIMQSHISNYGKNIQEIKLVGIKGNLVITDALYVNDKKIDNNTDYEASFYHQAKAFIHCIENGTKPLSTLIDVDHTLKIIYGAYKSDEENKVITL